MAPSAPGPVHRRRRDRRLLYIAASAFGALVFLIFVYNFVQGRYGFSAYWELREEAAALEAEVAALRAERAALERRVARLRAASLDADLLDEEALSKAGLAREGDLLILLPEEEEGGEEEGGAADGEEAGGGE